MAITFEQANAKAGLLVQHVRQVLYYIRLGEEPVVGVELEESAKQQVIALIEADREQKLLEALNNLKDIMAQLAEAIEKQTGGGE